VKGSHRCERVSARGMDRAPAVGTKSGCLVRPDSRRAEFLRLPRNLPDEHSRALTKLERLRPGGARNRCVTRARAPDFRASISRSVRRVLARAHRVRACSMNWLVEKIAKRLGTDEADGPDDLAPKS